MTLGVLEGKVALVTAGGPGIGRTSALMLAAHGAVVASADRSPENGHAVLAEIEQAGGSGAFFPADAADEPQVAAPIGDVIARFDGGAIVNKAPMAGVSAMTTALPACAAAGPGSSTLLAMPRAPMQPRTSASTSSPPNLPASPWLRAVSTMRGSREHPGHRWSALIRSSTPSTKQQEAPRR